MSGVPKKKIPKHIRDLAKGVHNAGLRTVPHAPDISEIVTPEILAANREKHIEREAEQMMAREELDESYVAGGSPGSEMPLEKSPKGKCVTWENHLDILPEAPRLSDFMLGSLPVQRMAQYKMYLEAHTTWTTYMRNEKLRRHQDTVVRREFEKKFTVVADSSDPKNLYSAVVGATDNGRVLNIREKLKPTPAPRKNTPLRVAKKELKAERVNLRVRKVQQKTAMVKSRGVAAQTETVTKSQKILNRARENAKTLSIEEKQEDKTAELRGTKRVTALELSAAKKQSRKAQLVRETDPTVFTTLNLDQGEGWQLVTRKKDRQNRRIVDLQRNEKGQVVRKETSRQ